MNVNAAGSSGCARTGLAKSDVSLQDGRRLPTEVITLSDGAPNRLEGVTPDRRFYTISRAEMHFYAAVGVARARAMVYPGGGYLDLVHDKEGIEIANWLSGQGVDAYVLTHRLPGANAGDCGARHPSNIALMDGLAGLRHLESLAPLPLLHVGLSSGGHLAGVMACQQHAAPPAGLLMGYAPINANHRRYKAPPGKPDYPPLEKQDFYDDWPIGIAGEPHGLPKVPTFLVYALHDQPVPIDHALNLIKAMQLSGGDVEAHIFPQAPHGFALRDLDGTHDQWPALAARWIDRVIQRSLR
jgi:acetyl esterase/lipase